MSVEPRVVALLARYEEAFEEGAPLTPEELCRDCPELLGPVRQGIKALRALDPVLTHLETPPRPSTDSHRPDADRQRIVELGGSFVRHRITPLNVCGNRQRPRGQVSVSRSAACTASA